MFSNIYSKIIKSSCIVINIIIFKISITDKVFKKLLKVFKYLKNWLNIKNNFSAKYLSIRYVKLLDINFL